MKDITSETTIGEIVRAVPATSRMFENLKVDYCCGGKKSLAEACRARGLDAATVIAMLSALDQPASGTPANADAMTLTELCDHIQHVHHGYLREELPRLDFMTRKVAAVHGEQKPQLVELRKTFEGFNAEITAHTNEEDEVVFPAIRKLEAGSARAAQAAVDAPSPAASHGSIASLKLPTSLEKLEREHALAGTALEQFKALSDNYTPPDWACNTFRALYDGLAQLEKNMHQHIHKENNVLFPKALALAAKRMAGIRGVG